MSLPQTSLDAADHWASRLDAGPLSLAEEQAMAAWLAENPGHSSQLLASQELLARVADSVERQPDVLVSPASPAIRPAPVIFRRLALGLAAAAAIAVAAVGWNLRPQLLETPAAQRSTILLADGSQVDLNARTSLAVRLRGDRRNVEMAEGEAYFAVAKDPARPFVIKTSAGEVRVTGTAFNVRSMADDYEVTVTDGTVEVAPVSSAAVTLHVGDQFRFQHGRASTRHLTEEAARDAAAWREGWVVFESEPLGSAVARFARYHDRAITVAADAADIEIGGRFQLTELDGFLSDVSLAFPVRVLHPADGSIRIVRRSE
jgi:transmembrane sensor